MKVLQCLLFLGFFTITLTGYTQQVKEKQLRSAILTEKNGLKQLNLQFQLANFYKETNIGRADSMRIILMEKSRRFNDSIHLKALIYSIEINIALGRQKEFSAEILASQAYLKKVDSEKYKGSINYFLGRFNSLSGDHPTADFYFRIALSHVAKDRRNLVNIYANNGLAINFMLQNLKDSAFFYSDKALKIARSNTDKSNLARCFNIQAQIYSYFDQVELNVAKNLVALKIAQESGNYFLQAQYNRELGVGQRLISNYKDAEFYFKLSYDFSVKVNDKRQMALALSNLGMTYFGYRQYAKAISYLDKSVRLLEYVNDKNGLAEAYNNLGSVQREQKKYDLAVGSFNQALILYESTGNKEKIAAVYHNVGTIFQKQGKYREALNYLFRSIEIRQNFGSKSNSNATYRVISEVYNDLGQKDNSLTYLKKYVQFQDSNTQLQASKKIAELNQAYLTSEREKLINIQADSIKNQRQQSELTSSKLDNIELKNDFKMYALITILIIVVLGGTIIFFRWNEVKIKQQQREAELSQMMLRAQMNPHFVFNAMSVIQSYIYENDTVNSSKFLVNFSRLMRLILENSPKEFISIATEVDILQKYLETQKLRFGDRFTYFIENSVEEDAVIPPMITQPFVENAIEHGQLHTIEGGFVRIVFTRENDMLVVVIEDNGVGRDAASKIKKGKEHKSMALNITKERINNLNKKYRSEGDLKMSDFDLVKKTGTKVIISLPFKIENLN
ncbi:MAG: tetratricopeptide repeat protein [Bacteroidota bacterium]